MSAAPLMASSLIIDHADTLAGPAGGQPIGQAGLGIAVAWYFTGAQLPGALPALQFPVSAALSAQAEALEAFAVWPRQCAECYFIDSFLPACSGRRARFSC